MAPAEPPQPEEKDRAELGPYCREIEAHLCRKNGGHLIRIVGPAFEMVTGWYARGVPLKIAQRGIDRAVERHTHTRRPSRRPLRIERCEADVLDAFDEWRRALGPFFPHEISGAGAVAREAGPARAAEAPRQPSLPQHLQRVLVRLSSLRAAARHTAAFDAALDAALGELDTMYDASRTARGAARTELLARLGEIDRRLMVAAHDTLGASDRASVARDAEARLSAYRARMSVEDYTRLRDEAVANVVRTRFSLPQIAL